MFTRWFTRASFSKPPFPWVKNCSLEKKETSMCLGLGLIKCWWTDDYFVDANCSKLIAHAHVKIITKPSFFPNTSALSPSRFLSFCCIFSSFLKYLFEESEAPSSLVFSDTCSQNLQLRVSQLSSPSCSHIFQIWQRGESGFAFWKSKLIVFLLLLCSVWCWNARANPWFCCDSLRFLLICNVLAVENCKNKKRVCSSIRNNTSAVSSQAARLSRSIEDETKYIELMVINDHIMVSLTSCTNRTTHLQV